MIRRILLIVVAMLICIPSIALADDWYQDNDGYFTVYDEYGHFLFMIGSRVSVDDEYISGDNYRYRVVEVNDDNNSAYARFIEELSDIELSLSVQKEKTGNNANVGIYCTHSDESYVPSDGTESESEEGGIFDVAAELAKALKSKGFNVDQSEAAHEPHDAGAYRRSRQTAVDLMKKEKPAMLLDIHRDAVPPEVYEENIEGNEASKIRLVVGKSNQNRSANEEFARKIKKVADEKYPGLIKDIFIGKGSYNQDLMPQAILFEMGTHTIKKERAIESTGYIADVLATVMKVEPDEKQQQDKAAAPNQQGKDGGDKGNVEKQAAPQKPKSQGSWKSILIIVGVLAAVGIAVLLIFNSNGERGQKFKHFWAELTGIGRRQNK